MNRIPWQQIGTFRGSVARKSILPEIKSRQRRNPKCWLLGAKSGFTKFVLNLEQ